MFEFGFWGKILFCFIFILYYAWPITVIFDVFFIYLVIKFVKQEKIYICIVVNSYCSIGEWFSYFYFNCMDARMKVNGGISGDKTLSPDINCLFRGYYDDNREDIMIFNIICLGNEINPGIHSIVMHNGYYSVSSSILHNTMRSLL
ncbi:hypothetical protein [Photorhabdus sp. SF281]|uniref:hypothetical protein n=1 Tax=Photorhabdus sp. SF281 TaxID=3459527 RepID=UPI004044B78D